MLDKCMKHYHTQLGTICPSLSVNFTKGSFKEVLLLLKFIVWPISAADDSKVYLTGEKKTPISPCCWILQLACRTDSPQTVGIALYSL